MYIKDWRENKTIWKWKIYWREGSSKNKRIIIKFKLT